MNKEGNAKWSTLLETLLSAVMKSASLAAGDLAVAVAVAEICHFTPLNQSPSFIILVRMTVVYFDVNKQTEEFDGKTTPSFSPKREKQREIDDGMRGLSNE